MLSSSVSNARRRFLLSLPWLALSLSALVHADARRHRAQQGGLERQGELQNLRQLGEQAERLGPAERTNPPLASILAQFIDLLRDGDARYGVHLALITIPGARMGLQDGLGDAVEIASLAHTLPRVPRLRALPLQARGTYTTYGGLQDWFAALERQPVSFDRIQVDDNQVQFSAHLYGT